MRVRRRGVRAPPAGGRILRGVPRPRIERDEPIDPPATKLPRSLIKRLRVRARQDDISVQDLVGAAIARELFLSPKTVSNNLTSIFAKLQVAGRGEAIVRARERGLGGQV